MDWKESTKGAEVKARFTRVNAFFHKEFVKGLSAEIGFLCVLCELRGSFNALVTSVRN